NDQAYAYRLVAVDTHGNRSPAATASATPTDLTPPGAPTAPSATAGERQVVVAWTAPADADVVGYRVLQAGTPVATATGTTTTVTGLAPGTAVTVTVVAVDGHGNTSAASAAVTATPYDRTAPAAPTAVTGRAGNGSATISWTAPADPDALAYRVYRDGALVTTVSASPTTVTGLTNGTTYSFIVVAVDPSGNASAASAAAVVVPVAGTVPAQGSGDTGGLAASADGRYVVVGTRAKLESSDTNTAYELYRIDRAAGTATRIAPLPAAATSADATNSAAPAISDDGRYVALATTVALVAADTNRLADVYRLDTTTGTWALVSVPASGKVSGTVAGTELQAGSAVSATSPAVVVSGDGDLVLFYSSRSDLGPADANGVVDVYAKRMSTGAVTRVSTSATGGDLPRSATGPALALTPDGRFALFPATGSGGPVVLYRKTLTGAGAGQATVVSTIGSTEVGVFRDTGDVDLSDDGRYVAFVTSARPTAPGSSGSVGLAYRKDTATGALAALGDGQTTAWEHQIALDPTGRWGFFSTTAAVTGDTNGHTDVFRRDLQAGTVVLVTADADGRPVTGPAGAVAAAEYGRVIAVSGDLVVLTTSQGLLPADTNRVRDLYVKDLAAGTALSPVA
ncbi:Fibronectin type III domain-containing protein, partial [Klenkia soli]